jgi:hypothetical protein
MNDNDDIDVAHELLNLHYHVHRLQVLLNKVLNNGLEIGLNLSIDDVNEANQAALDYVRSKFPERAIGFQPSAPIN